MRLKIEHKLGRIRQITIKSKKQIKIADDENLDIQEEITTRQVLGLRYTYIQLRYIYYQENSLGEKQ